MYLLRFATWFAAKRFRYQEDLYRYRPIARGTRKLATAPKSLSVCVLLVTAVSSGHASCATFGRTDLGPRRGVPELSSPDCDSVRPNYIAAVYKRPCVEAGRSAFSPRCSTDKKIYQQQAAYRDDAPNTAQSSKTTSEPTRFIQTSWFLLLCWLAAQTSALSIYRRLANTTKSRTVVRLQERQRIARELHDTLIQSTQGLICSFQGIAGEFPESAPMRTRMEVALDRADNLLREARDHVSDLRMICCEGDVTRALSRTAHELLTAGSVGFRVTSNGGSRALIQDVAEDIYRIGREALTNAIVHADAKTIELQTIYTPTAFTLRIRDDGGGIDSAIMQLGYRTHHFGLQGMRERATRIGARFSIRSHHGMGTEIELCVSAKSAYRNPPTISTFVRHISLLLRPRILAVIPHSEGQPSRSAISGPSSVET
jgi:signal transduction histidine kinase